MARKGFNHSFQADINLIRDNLRDRYQNGFPVLKELIQNADDAGATRMDMGVVPGLENARHPLLQGPALFVVNDGPFKESDERAIRAFGLSEKPNQQSTIGKFGLGLKSVFHICEAFFYLSSNTNLPGDILNPWSGDDDSLHPEWDLDFQQIDHLAMTNRLNEVLNSDSWFCVWIPLRQRRQCGTKLPITEYPIGDRDNPSSEIFVPTLSRQLATILPMLHCLETIRLWKYDEGNSTLKPWQELALEPSGQVRRYRGNPEIEPGSTPFSGNTVAITAQEGITVRHAYGGVEVLLQDDDLTGIQKSPMWPKLHTVNPDTGASLDLPDKADQHAAAYFTRSPAANRGSLNFNWSVFLPVSEQEESVECPGDWDYQLTLHGYFFVDAGRARVDFNAESAEGADRERSVQRDWNRILRDRGALPLVLPALHHFVLHTKPRPREIATLVEGLDRSALMSRHREQICSTHQWVYWVRPQGSQWQLCDSQYQVLEVPEPPQADPNRPWEVFPNLSAISNTYPVTYSSWPSIRRSTTRQSWPVEPLLELLEVFPLNGFASQSSLRYLVDFLSYCCGETAGHSIVSDKLLELTKSAIKELSTQGLRQNRAIFGEFASFLPANRILRLNVGSEPSGVANAVCDELAALDTKVLPLMDYLAPPETHVSITSGVVSPSLSAEDALSILEALADLTINADELELLDIKSRISVQVVNAVAENLRFTVLDYCQDLKLFRGYDCARQEICILSWAELKSANQSRLLFQSRPPGASRGLADHLQLALADLRVLVITQEVAEALFAEQRVPYCDASACSTALAEKLQLSADPASRLNLFKGLLTNLNTSPNALSNQRLVAALRYLIHTNPELFDMHSDLIIEQNEGTDSVWIKLVYQALHQARQSWRVVPSEFATALAPQQLRPLGLKRIDPDTVLEAIKLAGPSNIDCRSITWGDYEEILSRVRDYEVLRALPMHRDLGGNLCSIGSNAYLESSESSVDPKPFSGIVSIIKRSTQPDIRDIQYQYILRRRMWGPEPAIRHALEQDTPAHFCRSILGALAEMESSSRSRELDEELQQQLRSVSWVSTERHEPVAPQDILYIEGLEDEISRVVDDSTGEFIDIASLPGHVRLHLGFAWVKRALIPEPEEALAMIAEYASRDQANSIGQVDVSSIDLDAFRWAFRSAPQNMMPSLTLIEAVCEKLSVDQCIKHLLPGLVEPISDDRLVRVLEFLAHYHSTTPRNQSEQLIKLHCQYLQALLRSGARARALRRIRLLNRNGVWKSSLTLCHDVPGADDDFLLGPEHATILYPGREWTGEEIRSHQPGRGVFPEYDSKTLAELKPIIDESSQEVAMHLAGWEGYCQPELIGTFLCILGDHAVIKEAAAQKLGNRTVQTTRSLLDWSSEAVSLGAGTEDIHSMMERQRFIFKLVDPAEEGAISTENLVGDPIDVPFRLEYKSLILDNLFFSHVRDRINVMRLLKIEPFSYSSDQLAEMLKETIRIIANKIYYRPVYNLDQVWDDLKESQQLDIEIAQESLLQSAPFYLHQMDLPASDEVKTILQEWERANDAKIEAKHATRQGAEISDETGQQPVDEALSKLRCLLESDGYTQAALLKSVKTKVDQYYQYSKESVPFELFQNADDAVVELHDMYHADSKLPSSPVIPDIFVACWTADRLTFAHWGRPINYYQFGNFNGRDRGFNRDLQKMLVMNASDKSLENGGQRVTGKFGLGFKSVFLVCDSPRIISDRLAFEVVAGMYPKKLEGRQLADLKSRRDTLGYDSKKCTLFDLPLAGDQTLDPADIMSDFSKLANVMLVFAKRIKHCHIKGPDNSIRQVTWNPQPLLNLSGLGHGSLYSVPSADRTSMEVLCINADGGAILLSLDSHGFTPLPNEVPTVWVTAPTGHCLNLGLSVNGQFALDIGRAQLARDAAQNAPVAEDMGRELGAKLVEFHDAAMDNWVQLTHELRLVPGTDQYTFWDSLWDVVSRSAKENPEHDPALELIKAMMWSSDEQGIARLLTQRDSLPSKLAGSYRVLTRLPRIQYRISGVLDQSEALFLQVSSWDCFKEKYSSGAVVSSSRVSSVLERAFGRGVSNRVQFVDLEKVIRERVGEGSRVDPETASDLGLVISEDMVSSMAKSDALDRQEQERLTTSFETLKFLSEDGEYRDVGSLLTAVPLTSDHRDEVLQARFAPSSRVLSGKYSGTGLEFFLVCRPRLEAPVEHMVDWVRNLSTTQKQKAALEYLITGELGPQLARAVRSRMEGTWLQSIQSSMEFREFNDEQQVQILALLYPSRIEIPPVMPPIPTPPDVGEILEQVYDWWVDEGERHLGEYESRVFPDGKPLPLSTDALALRTHTDMREKWLELFMLGVTFRMGRQTPEQHRSFLQMCRDKGWTRTFANPNSDLSIWMKTVVEYLDDLIQESEYYQWFTNLVPIFQMARWLDEYVELFLGLENRRQLDLDQALASRSDPDQRGGGIDAPPLNKTLGIGACFIVRELLRQGIISGSHLEPYCYVPGGSVCELLGKLGLELYQDPTRAMQSRSIHQFLVGYLGKDRATFSGAFDIPLYVLANDKNLQDEVLGRVFS